MKRVSRVKSSLIAVSLGIVAALCLGLAAAGCNKPGAYCSCSEEEHAPQTYYVCPMHPEVQRPAPGKCPTCGMELVKTTSEVPQTR